MFKFVTNASSCTMGKLIGLCNMMVEAAHETLTKILQAISYVRFDH